MTVSCSLSAGPYCLYSAIICGYSRPMRMSTVNNPPNPGEARRKSDLITSNYPLHYSSATLTLRMAFLHSLLGRLSSPPWFLNLAAGHAHLSPHQPSHSYSRCHHLLPGLTRTFCLPPRHETRLEKGAGGCIFIASCTATDMIFFILIQINYISSGAIYLASPAFLPSPQRLINLPALNSA